MNTALTIVHMIVGLLLIITVLLQQKGGGLGATFGGGGMVGSTRRGSELALFRMTIGVSILFFLLSLVLVIL